ncbi:hypothetical protein ACFXUV_004330 [Salmonella enterica]
MKVNKSDGCFFITSARFQRPDQAGVNCTVEAPEAPSGTSGVFSPRQLRAFILATLMLFMGYVLTDSILFSGVTSLITIIGVLHYSRLPMTWHAQLKDGISRFESLRSSPLRQMDEADAHYDWHYASYCLAAEIQLIYSALSQPARPFSA